MGYSVATPIKSHKARAEMYDFITEHMRPWYVICEENKDRIDEAETDYSAEFVIGREYDYTRWPLVEGRMSYDRGKMRIGFNFTTSYGAAGDYMFGVLRWMALRAGRKCGWEDIGPVGNIRSVPYIVYDGCEAWPVLDRDVWEGRVPERHKQWLVDEHGFRPSYRWWQHRGPDSRIPQEYFDTWEKVKDLSDEVVHREMKRLSEAWRDR